jgi:hypothetical protein
MQFPDKHKSALQHYHRVTNFYHKIITSVMISTQTQNNGMMSEHTTWVYTLGQKLPDLCSFKLTKSFFKEGERV